MESAHDRRALYRKRLWEPHEEDVMKLDRGGISTMLPYREEIIMIDEITHMNFTESAICGRRKLTPDDYVVRPDFPGGPYPYPAPLLLFSMGQLGRCSMFLAWNHYSLEKDKMPYPLLPKVHQITYREHIMPNEEMTILCKWDDPLQEFLDGSGMPKNICVGQILNSKGAVAVIAVMEVYLSMAFQ